MFCTTCGAENPNTGNFCHQCGKELWKPSPNCVAAPHSKSDKLVVSKDGLGDCDSIADALARIKPNGLIQIRGGLYKEQALIIEKPIRINREQCHLEVAIEIQNGGVLICSGGVEITGLNIKGLSNQCSTIRIEQGNVFIEKCEVTGLGDCVSVIGSSANLHIRNSKIHSSILGHGLKINSSAKAVIEECEICGNKESGVEINQDENANTRVRLELLNCVIHDNSECGVAAAGPVDISLKDCDIKNARIGVGVYGEVELKLVKCSISLCQEQGVYGVASFHLEDCRIFGNHGVGFEAEPESDVVLLNCKLYDGKSHGVVSCLANSLEIKGSEIFKNAGFGANISNSSLDSQLVECRIFENRIGLVLTEHGDYSQHIWINKCDISQNKGCGIEVKYSEDSGGVGFSECKINRNSGSGLRIERSCIVHINKCSINNNADHGIASDVDSDVTYCDCHISSNLKGQVAKYVGSALVHVVSHVDYEEKAEDYESE